MLTGSDHQGMVHWHTGTDNHLGEAISPRRINLAESDRRGVNIGDGSRVGCQFLPGFNRGELDTLPPPPARD